MAKVSASTLVRRAIKTKDRAAAKRLRAMAAMVRREARAKKSRGNVAGDPVKPSFRRAYQRSRNDAMADGMTLGEAVETFRRGRVSDDTSGKPKVGTAGSGGSGFGQSEAVTLFSPSYIDEIEIEKLRVELPVRARATTASSPPWSA